jgi:hypothetical protein
MGRTIRRWCFANAFVQGLSHEQKNSPCQDYSSGIQSSGVTVIALADGAGSAQHSHIGAKEAVETTLNFLTTSFEQLIDSVEPGEAIAAHVRKKLQQVSDSHGLSLKDLACTLLFVAVKDGHYLAGNIGDGVVGFERLGQVDVILHPQRGMYANETYFLTSRGAKIEISYGKLNGIEGFILMSDGTAHSLYNIRQSILAPASGVVLSWLKNVPETVVKKELENNLRQVIRPRTGDDCSLAIVRVVSVELAHLNKQRDLFVREFLNCQKSPIKFNYRLKVLNSLKTPPKSANVCHLSTEIKVHPKTVKKHLNEIMDKGFDLNG